MSFPARHLARIRQLVAAHPAGIAVQAVGSDGSEPGWAYTIGLLERHGFELIVFMLRPEIATAILNDIARSLNAGMTLTLDAPMVDNPWIAGYPALFRRCDPELLGHFVAVAQGFHGREDVPVLQLVLCDKEGHFPGDAGYSLARQPLLYRMLH